MAAGMQPPRGILCHSHWTVDGEKMSKSKGNVVCPVERSSTYTADGLRYFLLREGVAHSDGSMYFLFSLLKLKVRFRVSEEKAREKLCVSVS